VVEFPSMAMVAGLYWRRSEGGETEEELKEIEGERVWVRGGN
jgi:hypothetical protein